MILNLERQENVDVSWHQQVVECCEVIGLKGNHILVVH